MSFINHRSQLAPAPTDLPQMPSIWRLMLDAVTDGRRHATEQVLSDMVARNGGRLTDDIERQIAFYL
jgi:hypothetical protein